MKATRVFRGSDLKLNIHIEPLGELSMEDYEWKVKCYCSNEEPIIKNKSDAIFVDKDNYIITIDTTSLNVGPLQCVITAYIPDEDFDDKLRIEISRVNTNIIIVD